MLLNKSKYSLSCRIITAIIIHAIILSNIAWAIPNANMSALAPPTMFAPIVKRVNGFRKSISVLGKEVSDSDRQEAFRAKVLSKEGIIRYFRSEKREREAPRESLAIDLMCRETLTNSFDSIVDKLQDSLRNGIRDFRGEITIELYSEGKEIIINIIDNGKPIEFRSDGVTPLRRHRDPNIHLSAGSHGGKGIEIANFYVKYLGGSITRSALKNGTKTEIRIPIEKMPPEFYINENEYIFVENTKEKDRWQKETVKAVTEAERHVGIPAEMNRIAFYYISMLIGQELHKPGVEYLENPMPGARAQAMIDEIRRHVKPAELAISKTHHDRLLAGFELDKLRYDQDKNAYYLPIYREGIKTFYYRFHLDKNQPLDWDIPLGGGTSVYVRLEKSLDGEDDVSEKGPNVKFYNLLKTAIRNVEEALDLIEPRWRTKKALEDIKLSAAYQRFEHDWESLSWIEYHDYHEPLDTVGELFYFLEELDRLSHLPIEEIAESVNYFTSLCRINVLLLQLRLGKRDRPTQREYRAGGIPLVPYLGDAEEPAFELLRKAQLNTSEAWLFLKKPRYIYLAKKHLGQDVSYMHVMDSTWPDLVTKEAIQIEGLQDIQANKYAPYRKALQRVANHLANQIRENLPSGTSVHTAGYKRLSDLILDLLEMAFMYGNRFDPEIPIFLEWQIKNKGLLSIRVLGGRNWGVSYPEEIIPGETTHIFANNHRKKVQRKLKGYLREDREHIETIAGERFPWSTEAIVDLLIEEANGAQIENEPEDTTSPDDDNHPVLLIPISAKAEQTHSIKFAKAVEDTKPSFIALGTSWVEGYEKGRYLQYNALNPLISSIAKLCEKKNVSFICGDDAYVAAEVRRIKSENPKARGVVLAGEDMVNTLGMEDDINVFLAGVNSENLTVDSYMPISEMLTLVLRLLKAESIDEEAIIRKHERLGVRFERDKGRCVFFTPRAIPVDYEKLRKLYEVQRFV